MEKNSMIREDVTKSTPCHSKKIPLWLVLLDNVPTLLLYVLGYLIVKELSLVGAIVFAGYSLFSMIWFWAKICPYCHHYGTYACPCGYGAISKLLFKQKDPGSFKKIFKRNLGVVYPNWFVPVIIAFYLLMTGYEKQLLYYTILFSIIGFLIIPVISKLVGCKNCEIKNDCPWMTKNKRKRFENLTLGGPV